MKKVVVLVPVHCAPKVAMMTLGSWLAAANGSYEAEIIVGVHSNYHHYYKGLQSLLDLPVRLSQVPEVNWIFANPESALLRYSTMHAISLKAMLELASTLKFDNLVVLDHDLVFKKDLIGWAIRQYADLIGVYMDDRKDTITLETSVGPLVFAPKFSVWHMVMTAQFYQKIMEDVGLIFPKIEDGWFYDTFTRVVLRNKYNWKMPVWELPTLEMTEMVEHLGSMSFNFGQKIRGPVGYQDRLAKCEAAFDLRFPDGIQHLFKRVGL